MAAPSTVALSAPWVAMSTTVGWLRIKVPVLSNAATRTWASRSNAAPPLITLPVLVAAPIAAKTVTGIEIANSHGDAATSTTSTRSIQTRGSPVSDPIAATAAATTMIAGTRSRTARSRVGRG